MNAALHKRNWTTGPNPPGALPPTDDDAFDPRAERAQLEAATEQFMKLLVRETFNSASMFGTAPRSPTRRRLEAASRSYVHLLCKEAVGSSINPIDRVALMCARVFDVAPATRMFTAERTDETVRPRQVAMFLASTVLHRTVQAIGRRFHRDHSTVKYGVETVTAQLKTDAPLRAVVDALEKEIEGGKRA